MDLYFSFKYFYCHTEERYSPKRLYKINVLTPHGPPLLTSTAQKFNFSFFSFPNRPLYLTG